MEIIQHKFFKFCVSKFHYSNHRIGSLIRSPARIIPYPTGRLFWMAASQAIRAWLRSYRPSGTNPFGADALSCVLPRVETLASRHFVYLA